MDDFYDDHSPTEPSPYDPLTPIEPEPVEEILYAVTLSDGTTLSDLHLNGNNFVSDTPVTKEQFDYNCSPVTISDGEITETYENMELVHLQTTNGQYYFVLRDIPPEELWKRKVTADVQYISMMTEVELD